MRRFLTSVLSVIGGVLISSVALAADGSDAGIAAIGSALAIGLAALGGTMGQGKVAGSALEGIARNPESSDKVFTPMIIALALIEFQAIMGFIIAYLLLG